MIFCVLVRLNRIYVPIALALVVQLKSIIKTGFLSQSFVLKAKLFLMGAIHVQVNLLYRIPIYSIYRFLKAINSPVTEGIYPPI